MHRLFSPLFLVAVAGGVGWYNYTHGSSQMALFGTHLVTEDPVQQGYATVGLLLGLAGLTALYGLVDWVRSRPAVGDDGAP